ncbi:MAG TPA: hypothetical protein VI818_02595, partial [Candidatus Thermoplasmatota archaeon]|nr:hypothetical protein [Candidatus Thermoplasmatota archaeon]
DPNKPVEAAIVPCRGVDVGVVDLPMGKRIMTISSQGHDTCPNSSPSGGIRLVDVTVADNPKVLGQVALPAGSHSHSPWGDSGLIFNSQAGQNAPQNLPRSRVEILNISDPLSPRIEAYHAFPTTSTALGCHDIFMDLPARRAFCSAASETQIWDMTNPLAPKVLAVILNPKMQVHHWAATSLNGTLLVIGDESGGFVGPACTPGQPLGALWAYDIKEPTKPIEKGYFVPPRGAGPFLCTAHYYNFIANSALLVGGFYTAGTVLVDFTNPAAPKMIDQEVPPQANVWSSYWNEYDDHVYVGDVHRGLDVFRLHYGT